MKVVDITGREISYFEDNRNYLLVESNDKQLAIRGWIVLISKYPPGHPETRETSASHCVKAEIQRCHTWMPPTHLPIEITFVEMRSPGGVNLALLAEGYMQNLIDRYPYPRSDHQYIYFTISEVEGNQCP
jgi:hypothetical protein